MLLLGKKLEINPSHLEWKTMLVEQNAPFLKRELLRDNPMQIAEVEQAFDLIALKSDYPVELIFRHLERIQRS